MRSRGRRKVAATPFHRDYLISPSGLYSRAMLWQDVRYALRGLINAPGA